MSAQLGTWQLGTLQLGGIQDTELFIGSALFSGAFTGFGSVRLEVTPGLFSGGYTGNGNIHLQLPTSAFTGLYSAIGVVELAVLVSVAESLSLSDYSIAAVSGLIVGASDTLSLIDTFAGYLNEARSITDSLILYDSATGNKTHIASISNTLMLTDTVSMSALYAAAPTAITVVLYGTSKNQISVNLQGGSV